MERLSRVSLSQQWNGDHASVAISASSLLGSQLHIDSFGGYHHQSKSSPAMQARDAFRPSSGNGIGNYFKKADRIHKINRSHSSLGTIDRRGQVMGTGKVSVISLAL